ncbi:hypothetical protein KV557_24835 [Kitasatospora aureofaciens]|uniref:hypothetical protein n=1 Tax=Kitasatospora aureofaciens TaxID=1894 RepID=UPI001C496F13|nr:hypothetical protein [Kitasatospora aureofaciens]MBV6700292.1 hypothetical protein [Kitasatospora aureofaciens]
MDFTTLDRLTLEGTTAVLKPVYDPVLRTFSVQLWEDGKPSGIHGLIDPFQYADEPLEGINDFLAEAELRPLTVDEQFQLYAGLVKAKGGPDWQLFLFQVNTEAQD